METHVKVLGVLMLVCAAIAALFAIGAPLGLGVMSMLVHQSGDPDAATGAAVMGMVGAAAAVIFGLGVLFYGVAGYGVLKRRSWGRIMGIVVCALGLLNFPYGTALGIYGLWVLLNKNTEALFKA